MVAAAWTVSAGDGLQAPQTLCGWDQTCHLGPTHPKLPPFGSVTRPTSQPARSRCGGPTCGSHTLNFSSTTLLPSPQQPAARLSFSNLSNGPPALTHLSPKARPAADGNTSHMFQRLHILELYYVKTLFLLHFSLVCAQCQCSWLRRGLSRRWVQSHGPPFLCLASPPGLRRPPCRQRKSSLWKRHEASALLRPSFVSGIPLID